MSAAIPPANTAGYNHPVSIQTQGIKYAGSKMRLIPHILNIVDSVRPTSVLDGFSGTTRVSQAFAQLGANVTCSDISAWSSVLGTCYLKARNPSDYADLIEHLNHVRPIDGWFTRHYGGDPEIRNGKKYPWQRHNTMKLDGIRREIDLLGLSEVERAVALTSLMIGLNKVDNTLGHFASYLKDWSERSFGYLTLDVPKIIRTSGSHHVLRRNVFDVVQGRRFDLAYFDPPYGSNNEKMPPSRIRYNSYYHLWTTICLNDAPDVFGAARRREDSRDTVSGSVFEEFRKDENGEHLAVQAIRKLLYAVNAKHIVLSYSSGGRATAEELRGVIDEVGELVSVKKVDYRKNVMSGMRWTNDWVDESKQKNLEFLFHIRKQGTV